MLPPLLATFGMVGLVAGLFGLYLARLLTVDGSTESAAATIHNATVLTVTGMALLLVGMFVR